MCVWGGGEGWRDGRVIAETIVSLEPCQMRNSAIVASLTRKRGREIHACTSLLFMYFGAREDWILQLFEARSES